MTWFEAIVLRAGLIFVVLALVLFAAGCASDYRDDAYVQCMAWGITPDNAQHGECVARVSEYMSQSFGNALVEMGHRNYEREAQRSDLMMLWMLNR